VNRRQDTGTRRPATGRELLQPLRAVSTARIHFLGDATTFVLATPAVADWLGWELVHRHGVGIAADEGAERRR
jgi:hypothetical protein